MSAAVKPEIYISWIPTGKIKIKPEIYISYIPSPTKATADTFRKTTIGESNSADTFRQVTQNEEIIVDTFRNVVRAEKNNADLERKLFANEKTSGDIFRLVVEVAKIEADIYREVKKTECFAGDTSRKIGLITISGDTRRNVKVNENGKFDICRKIANEEETSADLYLKVARGEIAKADIYRKVTNFAATVADTERKVGIREKISADTKLVVCTLEKVIADTFLKITATEKATADLQRRLREFIFADTCRKITRNEKAIARTAIRIPHILNYVLQNKLQTLNTSSKHRLLTDRSASLVNTFQNYGVTMIDITLNEKTLSDTFRLDMTKDMDIEDSVQGKLLDYPFCFLVEEVDQNESATSISGKYSKDEQLYTPVKLTCFRKESSGSIAGKTSSETISSETEEITYLKASELVSEAASYLGLSTDIKIDDFTPTNISSDTEITYADLLSNLFNWTSKLPQMQINVFIRDGVLHCIQRGKEDSVFDITDLPHSRPTSNKKLIRTMWASSKGIEERTETDDDGGILDYQVEDVPQPFSGTISFSDVDDTDSTGCSTTLVFSNGLLTLERNSTWSSKRSTSNSVSYSYKEIFPAGTTDVNILMRQFTGLKGDWYLTKKKATATSQLTEVDADSGKKEIKKNSQSGSTNYFYTRTAGGDLYLQLERESSTTTTTTITFDENGAQKPETETKSDSRETYHVPLGNGWYGQSVYQNGLAQGSNISQGVPGNKVTQYTVIDVQKTFWNKRYTITYNNQDSGGSEGDGSEKPYETDDDLLRQLTPINDTSFPVRESDIIKNLIIALLWLNRKIQKSVTVDLISKVDNGIPEINHVVDFTERVQLDGEEYFLVSNKISFTPRKFIQKLNLVRWY